MNLPGFEAVAGLSKKARELKPLIVQKIKLHRLDNIPDDWPTHVQSCQLEEFYSLSGSEIRAIINAARQEGEPIGSDSNGYFYATRPEQLETTIQHIDGRISSMAVVGNSLKKIQRRMLDNDPQLGMNL